MGDSWTRPGDKPGLSFLWCLVILI